jgi:hypothetical protein
MTVHDPFRRAAERVFVSRRECRGEAIADDSAPGEVMLIINPLGIGTADIYRMAWVWERR